MDSAWLKPERIEHLVQVEPAVLTALLVIGAWSIYKLLLKNINEDRHRTLQSLFKNLGGHVSLCILLSLAYTSLQWTLEESSPQLRLKAYVGLATLLSGATVFVKVWRILVFEYLFLSHMKAGVPLLLVNLFSLLLSLSLGGWIATEVFGIRLAPLLATSAIFSVVLGLALQDTLGNLFAGVAMQFDKPYEIGDWIEIQTGSQKWVGQVQEISWRSTVLIGWTDESITVPNRTMAQAQIANFATKTRPIVRSILMRFPYSENYEAVKNILIDACKSAQWIRQSPAPKAFGVESSENGFQIRLIYFLDDYGKQIDASDEVLGNCLKALAAAGITPASHRLEVTQQTT
jgi:small-conductance mechanosensitive channel